MAHERFPVEVLTPEGEVFSDEVEMISTHTGAGNIGILAHHQPVLARLDPAELKLYRSFPDDYESFAQGEGYLQMIHNRALVLVEEAVRPEDLDRAELEEKKKTAERELELAEPGSADEKRAARDKSRWERFLTIASER